MNREQRRDQAGAMRRLLKRQDMRARDPRLDVIDRQLVDNIDRHVVLHGGRQLSMRHLGGVVTRCVRTVQRRVARLISMGVLKRLSQTSKWGDPEANRWVVVGAGGGGDMGVTTYARAGNLSPSERSAVPERGGRRRRDAAPPADGGKWTTTYSFFDTLREKGLVT